MTYIHSDFSYRKSLATSFCLLCAVLVFHLTLLPIKQRWVKFFSCVQRRLQSSFRETITLFIENKCWHLKGAQRGRAYEQPEVETASGAI